MNYQQAAPQVSRTAPSLAHLRQAVKKIRHHFLEGYTVPLIAIFLPSSANKTARAIQETVTVITIGERTMMMVSRDQNGTGVWTQATKPDRHGIYWVFALMLNFLIIGDRGHKGTPGQIALAVIGNKQ